MRRDPLQVLSRLRRIGLDAARRGLADRLAAQTAAAARLAMLEAELVQEREVQCRQPEALASSDDYVAWLRRMRDAEREADAAVRRAEAATDAARLALHNERAGCRVLEAELAHAQRASDGAAARQEQAALDEMAGHRVVPRR